MALSHLASLAPDVELTLTELARRTATGKSNASRAVQRLVTAGLAECEIVSDNRRQRAIRITAAGRLAQQAAKPSARTGARAAIEALPAEDAATFERILGVCLEAVDRI